MKKGTITPLKYDQMHEDATGKPFFIGEDFSMIHGSNILGHADISLGAPYKCDDCRLFIVTGGEMDITVNLLDYHFHPGTVGYFGRGCNIQVNSVTDDFALDVILFKDGYLVDSSLYKSYFGKDTGMIMSVGENEGKIVRTLFQTVWDIVRNSIYNKDVIVALTSGIMHYYDVIRHHQLDHEKKNSSRREDLLKEFVILVNAHSGRERQLAFYADKMCITEKYLCLVVKSTSGKTPREWIDRAAVTNAKVLLKHTDMQISQISDRMNFPRSSAFCKYFKRKTGLTPQEYRDQ